MDQTKTALAAGIAGGYLLGRSRKAKLAFAVATYVIGRRFPLTPRHLVGEGARRLREHPRYGELSEQVSGNLLAAGRNAVTAATTSRIDALSEALRQGAQTLDGAGSAEDDAEPERDTETETEAEEGRGSRGRAAAQKKGAGRKQGGKQQRKTGRTKAEEDS